MDNIDLLYHVKCYLYTDAKSLIYLVRMSDSSAKASRWLEFLSGFDIHIVFLPNSNAILKLVDFLTRPFDTPRKKVPRPIQVDKNLIDFAGIQDVSLPKLLDFLRDLFASKHFQLDVTSPEEVNAFQALPILFHNDFDAVNFSFNHQVHLVDMISKFSPALTPYDTCSTKTPNDLHNV